MAVNVTLLKNIAPVLVSIHGQHDGSRLLNSAYHIDYLDGYCGIQDELKEYLISQGASDVGFCSIDDGDFGECRHGISIVVRLSENIVDEIGA